MATPALTPDTRPSCFDTRIRQGPENFSQPLQNQGATLTPLVLIIVRDKRAHPFPILFLDLNEKMRAVQVDLAFHLPEPDEVYTNG